MTDRPGISRREALRRASLLAAGAGLPFSFVACAEQAPAAWANVSLEPVQAPGYGTDPNLVHPAPAPWPNTLTPDERRTLALLVDILVPAENDLPSASDVGVVEVLDEWVSAPYPDHQNHRAVILAGLDWCDREAALRYGGRFGELRPADRIAIVEDIAYPDRPGRPEFDEPRAFFDLLRRLTVGAYYTSPEGWRELGYVGNVPIAGDYPGPTDEAMAHLHGELERLGLSL